MIARLWRSSAVRYLVIGGFSFLIDFGLVALFHEVVGLPVWLAAAIGFLTSFAFNYTLQRWFSFGSRAAHGAALAKYTALVVVNTVITSVIVALGESTIVGWVGGKIVATLVTTIGNYFAYRFWIFPAHAVDAEE